MTQPTDSADYRMERIKRLLRELEYEITRGLIENEIDEHIQFRFVAPSRVFPSGVVACCFDTRPVQFVPWAPEASGSRLKLVKK